MPHHFITDVIIRSSLPVIQQRWDDTLCKINVLVCHYDTASHVWGLWHTLPVNLLTRTQYSIIDSTWHGHTRSRYHERLSDGNKGYVALHIQYHHHTSIVSYQTQDRTNWLCRNLLEVVMIGARLDIRTERMKYFHWRIITPFFLSRDRRSVLRLGEAPVSRLLEE